ncbi:aspartate carbamoyltransferase catalytic subunit [Salipaludibacillus agaradhaerens]|uniref:aspartate carbamoyltransferase catalytic subunit n=1 Tax=Salipaludibacillus agaradhaerens TaxID=76935 RepID=UPI002151B89E|nr:aspartate carbamoyltransferase catalytic subunit [Salipaludibacillus agaradhaerens]MCR6107145.1 aspartate carbamoyltransferase catalytic subunit [Salipaludibacillus agaradhaerens]MCR6119175.1 aspartate carbamoyltransferase catalytic subunit [Salipaludibacillus agaradhaerens]
MKQLRTLNDLTLPELQTILFEADTCRTSQDRRWGEQPIVANLFFEPSTRTKCSFEMAEKQLGIDIIPFDVSHSSVQKGETLYDTAKTLEAIGCRALIIRHPEMKYYEQLNGLTIPIINAGDGAGDHPTQSLLDLLTIKQEFNRFDGLHVVICGDIRHSRVAHTNAKILKKLGARVSYSGPLEWMDPELTSDEYLTMDEAVVQADVLMLLRIQTERHDGEGGYTKETYHRQFGLTVEREMRMKSDSIIMHPAPVNRGVELAGSLVECRRSRIFKQMTNGVKVRKAILAHVLNLKGEKQYDHVI